MLNDKVNVVKLLIFLCLGLSAAKTKLMVIEKDKSLKPIIDMIKESKIAYSKIVVAFDFDQTLTAKKGMTLGLRGGAETKELIDFLNSNKINWFVITASSSTTSPAISFVNSLKLTFPENLKNDCQKEVKGKTDFFEKLYENIPMVEGSATNSYSFKACNNIITGYSAPYRKNLSLEFAMQHYKIPYPELIIFVDDSAKNVITVYDHYKTGDAKDKKVSFIGIVYEPVVEEAGHAESMQEIKAIIEKQQ